MTAQASRSALPPTPAPTAVSSASLMTPATPSVPAHPTQSTRAPESMAPTGPLRRVPVQGRSVARVARMLDACAALVDEIGYEALTTTLLAERAGVAIGSIYQFFSDKRAVVQALTLRNLEAYLERLAARFGEANFSNSWDGVDASIDEYIAMHREVPGFRTLHFGDVVDVHLLDEDRDNNSVIASALAAQLAASFEIETSERLDFALMIAVETADALIKLAFRHDRFGDARVLAEVKTIIRDYLEGQFSPHLGAASDT